MPPVSTLVVLLVFLTLGLGDPALARVQRLHFTAMYELCLQLVRQLVPGGHGTAARRLHADPV